MTNVMFNGNWQAPATLRLRFIIGWQTFNQWVTFTVINSPFFHKNSCYHQIRYSFRKKKLVKIWWFYVNTKALYSYIISDNAQSIIRLKHSPRLILPRNGSEVPRENAPPRLSSEFEPQHQKFRTIAVLATLLQWNDFWPTHNWPQLIIQN